MLKIFSYIYLPFVLLLRSVCLVHLPIYWWGGFLMLNYLYVPDINPLLEEWQAIFSHSVGPFFMLFFPLLCKGNLIRPHLFKVSPLLNISIHWGQASSTWNFGEKTHPNHNKNIKTTSRCWYYFGNTSFFFFFFLPFLFNTSSINIAFFF